MTEQPQEPQPPPQQPPPAELKSMSPVAASARPAVAKLETSTFVRIELQAGHGWPWSLSADEVRTSKLPAQLSHRYS